MSDGRQINNYVNGKSQLTSLMWGSFRLATRIGLYVAYASFCSGVSIVTNVVHCKVCPTRYKCVEGALVCVCVCECVCLCVCMHVH